MNKAKKVTSKSTPTFLEKGGSNKMNTGTAAGPQKAFGTGAVAPSGSGGKFPMGGSGKMHSKQSADAVKPGKTGK